MEFSFIQTYVSKEDNSRLSEAGKAYYSNNNWRWDYFGEDRRIYIINKEKIYEISEDGKEEINMDREKFNNSILNFIKRPSYFLKKRKTSKMGSKLIIYGEKDDSFKKVIISFSRYAIKSILIFDLEDNIIEFTIKDIKLNIPISEKIFNITKLN